MTEDFDVLASRAVKPMFFRAPHPANVKPREFQHAGVEYRINRRNGLIGDAPGVGKTAQGIMTSNAFGAKRTLAIVPASLRLNWEREVWMWSTIENVVTYPVLKASDGISSTANWVIMSYDLLRNPAILDAIMDLRWDHLILDEAHKIKEPKGNKTTIPICAPDLLPSVVGPITLLSGTILPNQPIECYNACRLLDWDCIDRMSLEDFRNEFYDFGEGFVRKQVFDKRLQANVSKLVWSDKIRNVPTNLADLQYRLRKHIMVRRLKEDVLHELPPRVWQPFPIQMDAGIRSALKHPGWTQAQKLYDLDPTGFQHNLPIDGQYATARRLLGEAKAPAVCSYIEDLLEGGAEKVVVSAWHHSVLDYMRGRLDEFGLTYMDGRTSAAKRQKAVDDFQTRDDIRIILGQTQTLGEGWTLTRAQDAVLCEPDPVPGKNDQLLDRIHRMGQKGDYLIGHVPLVPGTLDERLMGIAIGKDQNIYMALDHHQGA